MSPVQPPPVTKAPGDEVAPEALPPSALESAVYPNAGPTPLQGHVAFFDPDNDGIIWPTDTYNGFMALGYGFVISFFAVFVIHPIFSYLTYGTWIPDPFFRLKIKNVHMGLHGSDSKSFSRRGLWNDFSFDEMFKMYGSPPNHDTLTLDQAWQMTKGNRDPFDLFGWIANMLEWLATYLLLWPRDRKMKKEDIRGVLNGTIFYTIAEKNRRIEQAIAAHKQEQKLARVRAARVKAEGRRAYSELARAEELSSDAIVHAMRAVEAHNQSVSHVNRADSAMANARRQM